MICCDVSWVSVMRWFLTWGTWRWLRAGEGGRTGLTDVVVQWCFMTTESTRHLFFFEIIGEAGKKVDAEIFIGAVFCLPSGPKPLKAIWTTKSDTLQHFEIRFAHLCLLANLGMHEIFQGIIGCCLIGPTAFQKWYPSDTLIETLWFFKSFVPKKASL